MSSLEKFKELFRSLPISLFIWHWVVWGERGWRVRVRGPRSPEKAATTWSPFSRPCWAHAGFLILIICPWGGEQFYSRFSCLPGPRAVPGGADTRLYDRQISSRSYFGSSVFSHFWTIVLFSCSVMTTLWPRGLQHSRLPCPSLTPRVCSTSCPLS